MKPRYFFTGDHHFYHGNAIKYLDRKFASMEEMNAHFVKEWNRTVAKTDVVVYLGDLSFGGYKKTLSILQSLNGSLVYVKGNHDQKATLKALEASNKLIGLVTHVKELEIEGKRIFACHYPWQVWNSSHEGSFHVFSHSHNTLKAELGKSLDVSVDAAYARGLGYKPISFEYVRSILDGRHIHEVDKHTRYAQKL